MIITNHYGKAQEIHIQIIKGGKVEEIITSGEEEVFQNRPVTLKIGVTMSLSVNLSNQFKKASMYTSSNKVLI
jgi:hypothetical protein